MGTPRERPHRLVMRLGAAGLLGAVAFAVGACGQLGAAYKGVRSVPPRPVKQQLVDQYPAGTPQRTVLEWFGALQQADAEQASAFYAPQVRVTPKVIAFLRAAGSRYFARAQPPRVIGVSSVQSHATVFTTIEFRWSAPDGRSYVYIRPQAFDLQLSRGVWQLTDNYFLVSPTTYLVPKGPCLTC